MCRPANDFSVKNNNSRAFGEVLRTELRTVLPDLPLPPCDPPENPAEEAELEKKLLAVINEHPTELAALCLSGGGIRSASFALGAMQGLARFNLLEHFHDLSTVSGGGYIGSWLSAWRSLHGDKSVFQALNAAEQEGRDRPQIAGLRADSNYLTRCRFIVISDLHQADVPRHRACGHPQLRIGAWQVSSAQMWSSSSAPAGWV